MENPDAATEVSEKTALKQRRSLLIKRFTWVSIAIITIALVIVAPNVIKMSPQRMLGGAVWSNKGLHFISDEQISLIAQQINAPKEKALVDIIVNSTPSCESVENGFCQKSPSEYVIKTLVTPAIAYVPAIPDRKEITGYCTLCNDGTFSPSCAVGRGACSYHSGVNAYNVARYRTIKGTPAIQAQDAVYSYIPKSYRDSPLYISPGTPSLSEIISKSN